MPICQDGLGPVYMSGRSFQLGLESEFVCLVRSGWQHATSCARLLCTPLLLRGIGAVPRPFSRVCRHLQPPASTSLTIVKIVLKERGKGWDVQKVQSNEQLHSHEGSGHREGHFLSGNGRQGGAPSWSRGGMSSCQHLSKPSAGVWFAGELSVGMKKMLVPNHAALSWRRRKGFDPGVRACAFQVCSAQFWCKGIRFSKEDDVPFQQSS